MASTVVNTAAQAFVRRGAPAKLGVINGAGQVVEFQVSQLVGNPNGFDTLVIWTDGNLVATGPILEASGDARATWLGVVAPTNASSSTTFNVTTLNSDTAASTANGYTIAGLQGWATFRFGFTTFTSGSGNVWVGIAG